MKRLPNIRRVVFVVVAALLWSLLVGMPQASATESWPVTVSTQQRAEQVTTHAGGAVSVFRCSSGGDPASSVRTVTTYSSSGSENGAVPSNSGEWFCSTSAAVGGDSAVYGTRYNSTTQRYDIVTYQDGNELWAFEANPIQGCATPNDEIAGMTVGSDGDLYVLLHTAGCNDSYFLFGIDAGTGQQKFRDSLGASDGYTNMNKSYVLAYQSGVVVRQGTAAAFRYFSNAGVEDTAKSYTPQYDTGDNVYEWGVAYGGDLAVEVVNSNWSQPRLCSSPGWTNRIVKHVMNAADVIYDMSSYCRDTEDLAITPQGTIVLASGWSENPAYTEPLYFLKPNGDIEGVSPVVPEGYSQVSSGGTLFVQAGINGSVLMQRNLNKSSGNHYFTEYVLLSADGDVLARTTSEAYYDENSGYTSYMATSEASLANGFVYTVLCERTPNYNCVTTRLHKIPFAEAAIEYPRGLVNGAVIPSTTRLKYVALGDSFSSGEGAEPFYEATDILQASGASSPNECHRSKNAYAELLDKDPSLAVSLDTFAACSGAKTENIITTGQWNEQRQVNNIASDTDLITSSIGGNNAYFAQFVTKCLFFDCSLSAVKQPFFDSVANLGSDLSNTYNDILDKNNNSAQVYILGYPQLLPASGCSQTDAFMVAIDSIVTAAHAGNGPAIALVRALGTSAGLTSSEVDDFISQGQFEFSSSEVATAVSFVNTLNYKIKTTVDSLPEASGTSPRLHFVSATAPGSPFIGHELCSATPYFNGLTPRLTDWGVSSVYSFHPNALGQQAYAELVKSNLS